MSPSSLLRQSVFAHAWDSGKPHAGASKAPGLLLTVLRPTADAESVTLTRHRVLVQPSGHDTLEVRQRYLRRRRARSRDIGRVALWVTIAAIGSFLATVGLTVLVVGSR